MAPARSGQPASRTSSPEVATRQSATSYRHAIQEAMSVLNGQWTVAVLASLAARPRKYLDLREDINTTEERLGWVSHPRPVSQKVLSETLKRMRRDGLIVRSGSRSAFQEVWYELSPLGQTLLRSLRSVAKWAMDNGEAVAAARAQFDDAQDE
jgi:DNA-binding HxlR family transcriptional regulator